MMLPPDGASPFDNACQFLERSGYARRPGTYLVDNKNQGLVKLGLGVQRYAEFRQGRLRVTAPEQEPTQHFSFDNDIDHLAEVRSLLPAHLPCFFLISGDLKRQHRDPLVPLSIFAQPRAEITFSIDAPRGHLSYAQDEKARHEAVQLLQDFHAAPERTQNTPTDQRGGSFDELSGQWRRLETDDAFRDRLQAGIDALQAHPDGKITMMRGFERDLPDGFSALDLLREQSRDNGDYALSHYFCLDEETFSVGCTPENAYEIVGSSLVVDVVAGTCRSGQGEGFERRELTQNPKQRREHLATADARRGRYSSFCQDDYMSLTKVMSVKRLRTVSHLHSLLVGPLRAGVSMFDIIPGLLPIMGARPASLLPISDSDGQPHRFYGGIVGHSHAGYAGCFLNLRNALVSRDVLHAKVGMGLLRESVADSEVVETQDKIKGLMEAVAFCIGNRSPASQTALSSTA
jgi:Anthranilate/para-aminobenzoate synthases component I